MPTPLAKQPGRSSTLKSLVASVSSLISSFRFCFASFRVVNLRDGVDDGGGGACCEHFTDPLDVSLVHVGLSDVLLVGLRKLESLCLFFRLEGFSFFCGIAEIL